jgi:GT2 family glycosyltransferase
VETISASEISISVVIPSYQRRDCVLLLLESLFQQRGVKFEVIIVDDNSTDGTADIVASRYPQATIIREGVNRGPAACRNRGIWRSQGAIVVGLDSDTTLPEPDMLWRVQQLFVESPNIGGFAFRILGPDGKTDDVDRWWHPFPVTQFASKRFFTDYFSGTAFAFRKEVFNEARGFPEKFFMHYEEVELAFRVWDNNWPIVYCPELIAIHHENRVSRRSEARSFYKPRNQVLLVMDCYPVIRGLAFLIPRLGYAAFNALIQRNGLLFFKAMRSAIVLMPQSRIDRKPLKAGTWQMLAHVRRGTFGATSSLQPCK